MQQTKTNYLLMGLFALVLLSSDLMAAGAGGGLPWEAPLTLIVNSMLTPLLDLLPLVSLLLPLLQLEPCLFLVERLANF